MCKLFGMSTIAPKYALTARYYIRQFFDKFGPLNPHGWGYSFFTESGDCILFKEGKPAHQSAKLAYLQQNRPVAMHNLVGHVRLRSVGPINDTLAQPFTKGSISFAHNGTLFRIPGISQDMSDSLCMFQKMIESDVVTPTDISKFLQTMNQYGSMSVVIGTPFFLLGYRDADGVWPLHYRESRARTIVSSMPFLRGSNWVSIPNGHTAVIQNGRLTDLIEPTVTVLPEVRAFRY